jgi:hypothetical protein
VSRIVWLASYPKSGNTWLRVFLANLRSSGAAPSDINQLDTGMAVGRGMFDNLLGVESADMTADEIDHYRPQVYREIALRSRESLVFKIHDAYTHVPGGEPLFPGDATKGAVYLVRNPLDVAISFAHHSSLTLDESINRLADESFAFSSECDRLHQQLRQRLLSWSGHVKSWLDQDSITVHLMRYEDMHARPVETFTDALQFLGLNAAAKQVLQSLSFSSFEGLRDQERMSGFRERPSTAKSFFRKGRVGEWRKVLNSHQVDRVLRDHGEVMRRLGYLSEDGSPR